MDVERRREEAQRMRANQAQLASKNQNDDIPEEPLFDEPRKIDQSDRSAQHIKKIFGEWNDLKWVSGMPIKTIAKPDQLTGRQGVGSPAPTLQSVEPPSSLHQPRINGEHKHPPHFRAESRTPEVRQEAVSREHVASSSGGRGHPDNSRPKVDDRHRQTLQEHSSLSGHRQHPGLASASSSTSGHSLSVHGKPNHVRDHSHLITSHGGGAPHSVSPSKQHGSVVLSHSKPSVSPALPSSRDHHVDAPVHSVPLITAKVLPGSHVGSSVSDTHRRHLSTHPNVSKPGFSDHGRPDHRRSASQHQSITPPPSHRTPPPPVQRTPPPPRTPPPSHHHTPPVVSGDTGRSPSSFGQTKPKHLTLQIKQQQPVDFKDLDNIFEEMAVRPPHTAIQTPVKSSVNRFPFPSKSSHEDVEVPKAEPQSETRIAVTEELLRTPEERNSVLEDDLAVSDSEEEEETDGPVKAQPEEEPAAVEKKLDSPMSSSNETSSESESSSEDSSDSDSSSSDDEKDEEEEEKDTEEAEIKKEEPEENSQVGWGLKNFMVARPSPPVAPLSSSSQPSADSSLVKSLSPMEVKMSPRKMAEIGPCNSMPFMPHEDLDSILRSSEKASLSPDAPSTASSTASSQITRVKGQGWADSFAPPIKVKADPVLQDSIKQESVNPLVHAASDTLNSIGGCVQKEVFKSGPGRPKSVCSDRESVCGTPTKRKGSVKDREETSSVGSIERKRKRKDSASSVKSKESKPQRVRTSSSSDDVDVESVTPDPRTNQSSVLTKDKVLEGLDSVSKQLFISPLSSPVHHTEPPTDTKPATPTKPKSISRDHSSERGRRDSGSSTKSSCRRKSGGGGTSHIDSIMAEFKLPAMLSPTGLHHSPTPTDRGSQPEIVYGRSDFIPTATCGGPSILVRIVLSKLRNRPPPTSRNVCRTTGTKREALVPSVLSNSPSVTVVKGAVTASEDSLVPGVCNKNSVDRKPSPLPSNSSPVRISSSKVKKENLMSEKPSKKQMSSASKSASKSTTETLQNGISHSELKKASKRGSERRSSTSSNRSSTSKKLKKDSQSAKAQPIEVPQQNGLDTALPFNSYSSTHSPASHLSTPTPTLTPTPGTNTTCGEAVNDPLMPADDRLEQPDVYLLRAKELKHIADKAEKPAKLVPYVESILYFILWGYSQEKQQVHNEPSRVFPLYAETCQLLQFVSRFRNLSAGASSQEADLADRDKKLSVLILRMLALLNLKMFSLKKVEVLKFKKIIEHEYKNPSLKMSAHAPSPHQNSWNKNSTGTPSPMSPTPSPTCSIGSVGSQGSCEQSSKPLNGNTSTLSSPAATVPVPQRIHSVTQKYMTSTAYLVQAHDLWDQSDAEAHGIKDFFNYLDNRYGPLSLHSSVLQLVCYVTSALKEMGCS